MPSPEPNPLLAKIREAIVVTKFIDPPPRPLFDADGRRQSIPMDELIAETEWKLGVPMPPWLRTIYQNCNGFTGPYGEGILYRLDGDGDEGVAGFTLFLREMDWAPPWISRAIVFGYLGGSGSITTHSVALAGKLVEWCYGDGDQYREVGGELFDMGRRVQAAWCAW